MKRRALILSLIFCTTMLNAQTLLTGRVVAEQTHKPLARVSVVAEDRNLRPVAYALTKNDGSFNIKLVTGKTYDVLTFSLLGYAKQSIEREEFSNGQTVVMKEALYELKEVEVRSKRLRQRNDTLSYSVSGFRQQQDRSIADVIAKMPGLEVADNGTIRFQGKPISKFYIEGMDLMGKQYALASENINAYKVREVQVLRNHQDIKTLRGTQFSDHAALNLVLEKDAKGVWTGLAEAGLGTTMQKSEAERLQREGRVMAMMFGGKTQSLSMYKWNNTGKSIKNEVRDLIRNERTIEGTPSLTPDITLDAPDLMEHRYLMNDSRLLATNWLTKTGKDATIRLQLSGLLNQTNGQRSTLTTYSDALGGSVITEQEEGRANNSEWKGELEYKYNGGQLYVDNVAGGYMGFNKSQARTLLNDAELRQEAKPRRWWVSDILRIVKSMENGRSLQLNASAGYSYQPGTLLLADMTTQHVDHHCAEVGANLTFRHRLFRRLSVSYLAGINYNRQQFTVWRESATAQNNRYWLANSHLMPTARVKTGKLAWSASADLRMLTRHFMEQSETRFVAEPAASISYKFSGRLQLKGSYRYGWTPATLSDITEIPLFINYRTYTTGTGHLDASGKHQGLLRIEYADPVNGLFSHADALYTYQDKTPIYNRSLDGVMYHREATGIYSNTRLWRLDGRVSKSLGTMKFLIAVDGSLQRYSYSAMMSGQMWGFHNDNCRAGISLSLRPLPILSIEEKSLYQYSKQVCTERHQLDSPALRSFNHRLRVFLLPDKWQMEWSHEVYHSNDRSVSFTYFSDLSISYRTKAYEAGIAVNNLFGSKNYKRTLIAADATTCIVNSLRPREIMLKASINF